MTGLSKIPIPRSAIKREANESVATFAHDSPTQRRTNKIPSDSPHKFLKPALPPQLSSSPGSTVRMLSLAPTAKSPLATPPRRKVDKNNRLSMYGVPLSMSEQKSSLRRMTMAGDVNGEKRIIVCARKRPLSIIEVRAGGQDCISVNPDNGQMLISVLRTKLDGLNKYNEDFNFKFDQVYDDHSTNAQIYNDIIDPLVQFTTRGGKATCFAYGQTGSGKTHTMFNLKDGQCYQAIADLLRRKGKMIECFVSFFEIYQGQLYDLLRERKRVIPCEKKDGQVKIMGLEEDLVRDFDEAKDIIQRGLQARMTGKTGANLQSSRSHAILQFTLKGQGDTSNDLIFGRMSFIDLAGSERGADRAEVDRRTKLEGSEINKSLLALKECIRAMDQDASHLPFRQSKLTLVLKDSIIGDVRTAMIATVSPAVNSSEHSLNTLRYAERFHELSGPSQVVNLAERENFPPSQANWTVFPLSSEASAKDRSSQATPDKVAMFEITSDGIEDRRLQVYSILSTIRSQVQLCNDGDVLELLQEELSNISHAFQSLS